MRQAWLNLGVLQFEITSLSVLASHSTHQQTQFGSNRLKVSDRPRFELAGRNVWFELISFIYFSFHVRQHCQDEEPNATLMKLT